MKFNAIKLLEKDNNKKGDLFGRLMGDLFHALGYSEPRINIHKSGREIDIQSDHRIEKKIAIAECKAHEVAIGGADINKFVGALDAEKRRIKENKNTQNYDVVGYFISLSGFKETAIEQECSFNNDRLILIKPKTIVAELIKGRILVSLEKAVDRTSRYIDKDTLILEEKVDLIAYEKGWLWLLYYSENSIVTHFALIHAEGEPLVSELALEVIEADELCGGNLSSLNYICPQSEKEIDQGNLLIAKEKYFKYIENECGEIQFEGLPTDKDAGCVRVKLENIFVPLFLERSNLNQSKIHKEVHSEAELTDESAATILRESVGEVLNYTTRLAILSKPGGGKSTLIKRLAVAYAYPEKRKLVEDNLPDLNWFPIFIRCRDLGETVSSSITEIISGIPKKAELMDFYDAFEKLSSNALQKGEALILVDGLDEISIEKDRKKFVNQLRTFIATYPKINIIITSREAGFRAVSGSLSSYCNHYTISNLSDGEIEQLTLNWHKAIIDDSTNTINEAIKISNIILNEKSLKNLAMNPLLLTTLLFVRRWAGYLPTKKSILYQEMIKLLLVTWNVEGHEQIDLDEAEPQLAYIAFTMMEKGIQTITENELKKALQLARKQMPDILAYTKVSVSDFIKMVESRSSLLIMNGYKIEAGNLTPVYEFMHLSFQEYLASKAIVERYYPSAKESDTILSILKPYVFNDSWKEVVSLVAVLSKRETKYLIDYLIQICKDTIINNPKHSVKLKKSIKQKGSIKRHLETSAPIDMLGQCIANEIQISPEQLKSALEWYSKNSYNRNDKTISISILKSKFGVEFLNVIEDILFKSYDDLNISALGSLYGELFIINLDNDDDLEVLNKILETINSKDRKIRCCGIFALMDVAFTSLHSELKSINSSKLVPVIENIHKRLLEILKDDDKQCQASICWAIAWLGSSNLVSEQYAYKYLPLIVDIWVKCDEYTLNRFLGWSIMSLLNPIMDLNFISDEVGILIKEKYNINKSGFDKVAALFLAFNSKKIWDTIELKNLFKELANSPTLEHQSLKNCRTYFKALHINTTK
ncbi:NACHT domain-containing protein [Clostridium estertheticum]|uniref:NACHT domain-containing protein n=1 Tax=Clostridium estertheticum TaxID=238834 RepID=UPI001C7DD4B0|nr:NACHT domain-containing protein [Clostridium estertheticum]MBX4266781.1 NACHT domain-containing protein [Clostridium estertheticum]WLC88972.1 NACHT domain-containing protein [Clostridium estertheticum]